jgi:hypothetical protein
MTRQLHRPSRVSDYFARMLKESRPARNRDIKEFE